MIGVPKRGNGVIYGGHSRSLEIAPFHRAHTISY